MKNTIILILFILAAQCLFAQSATIKDPDGLTNVREKPNYNSKIIHKVFEGEFFFWVSPELREENDQEWAEVYIPRNKYSLEDKIIAATIKGYIHRSLIYSTEEIPKYNGSDFYFEYKTQEFNTEGKVIEYRNGEVYNINGRQVYGNDMSTPGRQVDEII